MMKAGCPSDVHKSFQNKKRSEEVFGGSTFDPVLQHFQNIRKNGENTNGTPCETAFFLCRNRRICSG